MEELLGNPRMGASWEGFAIENLIAAAGAPECIATVLAVQQGLVPPTLNLQEADEACDLDYVAGDRARPMDLQAALCNSFGFGGLNAAIVVKAHA